MSLDSLRDQIDSVDEQLQKLFGDRARLAQQVAEAKAAAGETGDCYRPSREAQVLRTVQARNDGPLSDEVVARLFREVMSACLALESPLKVAYLGPAGTFTEAAAFKHFGQFVETVPQPTIDEVFREVEAGSASYGVVPIENSSEGVVNHTLDEFLHSPLQICGEVRLRVQHNLLSGADSLADVDKVYAHTQALGQCRKWLESELPRAEHIASPSNAEGARIASTEAGAAAIASSQCADRYGLNILHASIEDEPDNTTRFLVIGKQKVPQSGEMPAADMTSLVLSTRNRAGALQDLLQPFADNDVSMCRIESRPSRREAWDYVFFIDVQGHQTDPMVQKALAQVEERATLFKVLGSYPTAVI